jgi:hypothetical protein
VFHMKNHTLSGGSHVNDAKKMHQSMRVYSLCSKNNEMGLASKNELEICLPPKEYD